MDSRFVEILGQDIVNIANRWGQLSASDLQELWEIGAASVHCVYDDWKDFATTYVQQDVPAYLYDCIDYDKATEKLKIMLSDDYTELSSGKIVKL